MDLSKFLIMRHEIVLTVLALVFLCLEIFMDQKNVKRKVHVAIGLFALVTVFGFCPTQEGTLFGGMFINDPLKIFFKNVLNIATLIVMLQAGNWLTSKKENENKSTEFYILIISTLIGMNFLISSGDFIMFYLGLELATIPMAALAAYEINKRKSAEAGVKLILSAALSSGIMLMGISFLYAVSNGSLYFTDLSIGETPLGVLGFIFFFAGLGFKISLVPFHFWTADVYEGAPISVTSYLSVVSKGAAVFILSSLLFTVFSEITYLWKDLLYVVALATMTVGNLFALRQQNMKRFLAFSSVAQAGFILLGLLGNDAHMSMTTVVYFLLIYVLSNLAAFGVVQLIANQSGKENMNDYNGLYLTNPMLSIAMMIALFSLAGIPPVAGFFGKFFLFTSAVSGGYYWLVILAVLNATISLYYYLLVVKAMFINKNETPVEKFNSDVLSKVAMVICIVGVFSVGLISTIYQYINNL